MIFKTQKQTKTFAYHLAFGFITAILFSAFIYLEHFGIENKFFNTVFALSALALLLYLPKKSVLLAGFFIGLFWFYWIGYSFKYTGVGYLTPFVTLGFAIIYMLFFGILALTNNPLLRALMLLALSYFQPFDFNWMQIELIFVNSYIGVMKYQLVIVLALLSLIHYFKRTYKYLPLVLLPLSFNYNHTPPADAPLNIKLVQTDVKQENKWEPQYANSIIKSNFEQIQKAIDEKYDLVVLPESCFPLFMNENPFLIELLKKLSYKIPIVAGALLREGSNNYNVTYYFNKGEYKIAKKMVLVPFGEYIPLPKFAQDWINNTLFDGEADFKTASTPTDFIIKGIKFRNAICYEATYGKLYEGDVRYLIATSNNAWFAPSIEPTLQKLLMEYYARKNNTVIYHSSNWLGTGIIK